MADEHLFPPDWQGKLAFVVFDPEKIEMPYNKVYRLPQGLPLPVFADKIVEGILADRLEWGELLRSVAYLLGHDPGHEHAAAYKEFLQAFDPGIEDDLIMWGLQAGEANNYDEALWYLRAAAAVNPQRLEAQYNLGLCALHGAAASWKAGEQERALARLALAEESLWNAIDIHRQFSLAWLNLGLVYQNAGRPEEALQSVEAALHYGLPEKAQQSLAHHLRKDLKKQLKQQGEGQGGENPPG